MNENADSSNNVQQSRDSVNGQNNSSPDKATAQSNKSGSAAANKIVNSNRYASSRTGTPVWKLGVGLMEVIVLGVLSQFVVSDMRVIRWFEQKKKRRF